MHFSTIHRRARTAAATAFALILGAGHVSASPPLAASSVAVASGDNQQTFRSQPFALPLTVVVKNPAGTPVSGKRVTFAGPAQGAGCDFGQGARSAVVTTDNLGLASAACTADATAGDFQVLASVDTVTTPAIFSLSAQSTTTGGAAAALPPNATVSFNRATLPLNAPATTAQLSIAISNPGSASLTQVGFSATLPSGLTLAAPGATDCSGTTTVSATTIALSNAEMTAKSSCTVAVTVFGSSAGAQSFNTGPVSAAGTGSSRSNTAAITVVAPPSLSVSFADSSISVTGSTSLNITFANPNSATQLSNAGFSGTFPAGLTVLGTPNLPGCFGSGITFATGGIGFVLSNVSLPAGQSCAVAVPVKGTPGVKTQVLSAYSTEGGNSTSAPVSLTIVAGAPVLSLLIPATLPPGGSGSLKFTLSAPQANSPLVLTGAGVSTTLPPGLSVTSPNGLTNDCGGTVQASAGGSSIALSGATLAAGASCSFSVNVAASASGLRIINATPAATESGAGTAASASTAVLQPPVLSIAFAPQTIAAGAKSSLKLNISNPNAFPIDAIAFASTLPAGLLVATPANVTGNCNATGGGVTAASGGATISLTGGQLSSQASCLISVDVVASDSGPHQTTVNVTSANAGNAAPGAAVLTVAAPPLLTQTYSPASIPVKSISTLIITVTNPAADPFPLTGVAFLDTLPAGLLIANPGHLTGSCGEGAVTAVPGSGTVALSTTTLGTGASCTISVDVIASAAGVLTSQFAVISDNAGSSLPAAAALTVTAAPVIAQTFGSAAVGVNKPVSLSFTVSNPAQPGSGSPSLSGVGFTDALPTGMQVAAPNALTGVCGGGFITATAGSANVALSGATLAAGASCTFSLNVIATAPGLKQNVTGAVTSNEGGTGNTASASITAVMPPAVSLSFAPASVLVNANSTLSFTIMNPAGNPSSLNGVGISDTLPAGLTIPAPYAVTGACGAGNLAANAGNISLTGATLAAGASCTFSVSVKGSAAGDYTSTTDAVTSAESGNGAPAQATLHIVAPPALTLSFNPATVPLNGSSTLTFTIVNPAANTGSINGLAFTNALPPGLAVAATPGVTGTCGGIVTALAGAANIGLANAALSPNASCSFSVQVMASSAGNITDSVTATSSDSGASALASASLAVIAPPAITEAFGAPTIPLNGVTTLTFTIANPAAAPANLTGVAFADALPAGMTVAASSAITNTCGGTASAAPGAAVISLSSGSVPAGDSCTFAISVTGTTGGVKNNITGSVTSNEGGTGNTASASLTVVLPPVLGMQFGSTSIAANASTLLTFTISNPAGNPVPLTGVSVTNNLPGALTASPLGTGNCSGATATVSGGSISLTGATLAPNGSCSFTVSIKAGGTGSFTNSAAASSANGGTGASASASLTITPALAIYAASLPNGAVGFPYSQALSATGGSGAITWSNSGALPPGLTLSQTGSISGTPTASGTYSFTAVVLDAASNTTSLGLSIQIAPALVFITKSLPSGTTSATYTATLAATGGTPPYAFAASGIPGGLSFSPGGTIAGTPTKAGSYGVTASVTDAAGLSVSAAFTIAVTAAGPLTVTGGSLAAGTVDISYSDVAKATGGAPPYVWTLAAGKLPAGLSVDSTGTVQGTPSATGLASFTLQATDASGASVSGSFSINVAAASLKLSGGSFPAGVVGSDYPAQILTPAGGVAPFSFAVSSGTLPSGITLSNGQISGLPAIAGTSTFGLSLTDSQTPPKTVTGNFSILIKPAQADLILSSSLVNFSLTTGAAGLPTPANVTVRSSVVQQLLNYSVSVAPAAQWLDVSSGGSTTPGSISISLSQQAMSLSPGTYGTSIVIACLAPGPCAGSSQTVSVGLTVAAPAPRLVINAALLSFSGTPAGPAPAGQTLGLQNAGGGSLAINSVTAADGWLHVSGVPSTVAGGPAVPIGVSVDPTGLAAGYYRSTIVIDSSAGSASIAVGLLLAANATISLSPAGVQFHASAGNVPGNSSGSFTVNVSGGTPVHWNTEVLPGADWLSLGTASGLSLANSPGAASFSLNTATVPALPAGAYYATIRVTSNEAVNSPQDFEVVLNITPATDPAKPDPQPAGLVFISSGIGGVPAQTVQIFASSKTDVAWQASTQTEAGPSGWLVVSPDMGTASTSAPGQSSVSIDPTGLRPGVYRGGVSYAFSGSAVRTVNVTLIVQAAGSPAPQSITQALQPHAGVCTPAKLVPTQTGLASNFSQATAWPTPLSVKVFNDCGAAVSSALVLVTFSNGDPPLGLTVSDAASGVYSGTWTPRSPAPQMTISARTTAPGYPAATTQITGQVMPNTAPLLTPNGTLHVFDPRVGGSLGPGNIVQIYGSGFANEIVAASTIPLPAKLAGASVIIGGMQAPLYFVSPGQINAQVPFELDPGKQYQILVNANGALTTPDAFQLTSVSPGIAAFADGGIIAQHLDGGLVSASAAAKPGELIICYLAGLGLTDRTITTGAGAPLDVLARPLIVPTLTLNGTPTPIQFVGLTPGLVGLYQANFTIPANTPDGDLRLVLSQGGLDSNVTILPVRH